MKLGLFGFVLALNWLCIGFVLGLNWLCFSYFTKCPFVNIPLLLNHIRLFDFFGNRLCLLKKGEFVENIRHLSNKVGSS